MNVTAILLSAGVMVVLGVLFGVILTIADKKFKVEVDPRVEAVRACLGGANCGACGYAGCDAVAAAIVEGKAPVNACPVCNAEAVKKIGDIMGVQAEAAERKVAYVHCAGTCDKTSVRCNYVGIHDCRAAVLAGISVWECDYGCLGFGSCAEACKFGALRVENGVAIVDETKCAGCGKCAKACPKGLIELVPADKKIAVRCASHDRGPAVKKACTAGCLGCGICAKQCEHEAITVDGNLAHVDYTKCVGCGKCAEKCPVKVIEMV